MVAPLEPLDDAGLRYRIAYSSASVAGIQAAVGSGLAVGVLGQSTLPPGTRRLSAAEGFRELPASTVVLRTAGGVWISVNAKMQTFAYGLIFEASDVLVIEGAAPSSAFNLGGVEVTDEEEQAGGDDDALDGAFGQF